MSILRKSNESAGKDRHVGTFILSHEPSGPVFVPVVLNKSGVKHGILIKYIEEALPTYDYRYKDLIQLIDISKRIQYRLKSQRSILENMKLQIKAFPRSFNKHFIGEVGPLSNLSIRTSQSMGLMATGGNLMTPSEGFKESDRIKDSTSLHLVVRKG